MAKKLNIESTSLSLKRIMGSNIAIHAKRPRSCSIESKMSVDALYADGPCVVSSGQSSLQILGKTMARL